MSGNRGARGELKLAVRRSAVNLAVLLARKLRMVREEMHEVGQHALGRVGQQRAAERRRCLGSREQRRRLSPPPRVDERAQSPTPTPPSPPTSPPLSRTRRRAASAAAYAWFNPCLVIPTRTLSTSVSGVSSTARETATKSREDTEGWLARAAISAAFAAPTRRWARSAPLPMPWLSSRARTPRRRRGRASRAHLAWRIQTPTP